MKNEGKNGTSKYVVLTREDVLELLLVGEKQKRINAEEERLRVELRAVKDETGALTQRLSLKYGVDLKGRRIESDGRVINRESGEPVRADVEV